MLTRSLSPILLVILWWTLTLPSAFTPTPPPLEAKSTAERKILVKALSGHRESQQLLLASWSQPSSPNSPSFPVSPLKTVAQTVSAAEILLAVSPIHSLVAVPRSVIRHVEIWPTATIPPSLLPTERAFSETLFHRHPDLAIVSSYSDPAMLATLRGQNISLHSLPPPNSFHEVCTQIERLGSLTGNQESGENLAHFLRSGFKHLATKTIHPKRLLVGGIYHHFTALGKEHLLIQCLNELNIPMLNHSLPGVFHTVETESVANQNPDFVILTTTHPLWMLKGNPIFRHKIGSVDERTAHATSQWLFLALYDIMEMCTYDSA